MELTWKGKNFEEIETEITDAITAAMQAIEDNGCDCTEEDGEPADRKLGEHTCLAGKCEAAIVMLEAARKGRTEASRTMGHVLHDNLVAMQSAWIEWQNGAGAEAAMRWIDNHLDGPGHHPSPDDPNAYDAQHYYEANRSPLMRMPDCACGQHATMATCGQYYCGDACRESQIAGHGPILKAVPLPSSTMGGIIIPRTLLKIGQACKTGYECIHPEARGERLAHVHVTDTFVEATNGRIAVRRPVPPSDPGRTVPAEPTVHVLVPVELVEHAFHAFPGTETEVEVFSSGGVAGVIGREARVQCPTRVKEIFPDIGAAARLIEGKKPLAVVSFNPWLMQEVAIALGGDQHRPALEAEIFGPELPIRLRHWDGKEGEFVPGWGLQMPMDREGTRKRFGKRKKAKAVEQ